MVVSFTVVLSFSARRSVSAAVHSYYEDARLDPTPPRGFLSKTLCPVGWVSR